MRLSRLITKSLSMPAKRLDKQRDKVDYGDFDILSKTATVSSTLAAK